MKKINFKASFFISFLLLTLVVSLAIGAVVIASEKIQKDDIRVFNNLEKKENLKESSFVQDEILVKFKNDNKPFRIIKVPFGQAKDKVKEFNSKKDVVFAELNYIAFADFVPNDSYYSPYQWHLDNATDSGINMEQAWDVTTGSNDVIVAVIDTGVAYEGYYDKRTRTRYYQAPDLANTCFVAGYDFINRDAHPNDDQGHGTHVTGTIAQNTNNNSGTAGVAFNTCIMPVKALDSNGSGSYDAIANAIYFAVDNGANIINMSLGGATSATVLEDAVAYAYNNGVTVIAAAGNDANNLPHYPSSYNDYVISVGATNYIKELAHYSNYGADVDVVAPGGDVTIDLNGDGFPDGVLQQTFAAPKYSTFSYYFYQGTSMASPHVAGVAALLVSSNTATTPDDIRAALETTTQDLGEIGKDNFFANGLVDAYAALQWTAGPVPNIAPTAMAGVGQTIMDSDNNGFEAVTLDAGASTDSDGTIENYIWTEGATLLGTSSVIFPDFSVGTHTITLVVTDNDGATSSDVVVITVNQYANQAPTVNAGLDQTLSDADNTGSETTTLTGTATDDGIIVAYEWRAGNTTIATTTTVEVTSFVGTTYYTFTATDNDGATNTDTVSVAVIANQAPTAKAGVDQTVTVGMPVSFDASDSGDSDGIITDYLWSFNGEATATEVYSSHTFMTTGEKIVTLTVTDNGGATHVDTVIITVQEAVTEIDISANVLSVDIVHERSILYLATAKVKVFDTSNSPVSGVAVTGQWTDANNKILAVSSGNTDESGQVIISQSLKKLSPGVYTFTITGVTIEGNENYVWDGIQNSGDGTL